MTITDALTQALTDGYEQIGQIAILVQGTNYLLCHSDDRAAIKSGNLDNLQTYTDPEDARTIGLYGPDGEYRFTKGQLDLITGWVIQLSDIDSLRRALDYLYPASLGLWKAHQNGTIRVQHLRDKLERQTGMYRFSKTISDEGAQNLVQRLCGPGNNCVKKILWQLEATTPLVESTASQFNGILDPDKKSIPLICQEACNFFVSKCRTTAKKEFEETNQ